MKWRCAVVSSDADLGGVIAEALCTASTIETLRCTGPSDLPPHLDGLVLVARHISHQQTCELIQALRREHPTTAVLAATADPEAPHLAAMFEAGIFDFVSLPVATEELLARIYRLQGASLPMRQPGGHGLLEPMRCFIGNSPNFARQIAMLPVFASCNAGVLITGETGTGKEICAQAVHYLSKRADRPWVAVNCGALPTELIEDELFGHVKGAYTTACATRQGLVREAEGGTLFLDDIDCLPLLAQTKLLRFLQEREYRPVGSNAIQRADVRVIAASNLQLAELVARGQFRRDLYFRLNVLSLELPPLRDRKEDIRTLALHFIHRFSLQFERQVSGLSLAALQRLTGHRWPGNVRELQHVMERSVLLGMGPMIMASDIELGDRPCAAAPSLDSFQQAKASVVRQFERSFVEQLLAEHGGNVTHAAMAARKNRRAFFELMRKHSIEPKRFRPLVA